MKSKYFDYLTREILEIFGDRKKEGRLSVVTFEDLVYPVPKDREHIEFCSELVVDPRKLPKVIPSHINYSQIEQEYEIISIITGESGIEQGYGIKHSKKDLEIAHQRVLRFINEGEVLIHPNLESRIVYDYIL